MRLDFGRRAASEQKTHHPHLFRPDGIDQRRQADSRRLQVDEGAGLKQQLRHVGNAALRREM
jgi:hypothetical protein